MASAASSPALVAVEADAEQEGEACGLSEPSTMMLAETSAEGVSAGHLAVVPFRKARGKPKGSAVLEKYLGQEHEGKSTEERIALIEARLAATEARLQEAVQGDAVRDAPVEEAWKELEAERVRVAKAISDELAAAHAYRAVKSKKDSASAAVDEKRALVLEAQKKLAMIQVVQENHATIQKLNEQRKAALQAVKEAKQGIMEHRLQGRKVLEEATKNLTSSHATKRRRFGSGDESKQVEEEAEAKDQAKVSPELSAAVSPPVIGADTQVPALAAKQAKQDGEELIQEASLAAAGA